jgi:glycosyltransferase involved in cell wall biosynthesis
MKVVVTGTRGIPNIQGGVETHCEELYPRLVKLGVDVTVIRRTPYIDQSNRSTTYKGVKLLDVFAPRKKSIEAIIHTFLAVIKARQLNADIIHIHAVGPSVVVPFAKLLGLTVVTTNHGPDYDRKKWGKLAKTIIRMGERFAAKYSDKVIVISKVIANILADKYGRTDTELIFNGVEKPIKSTSTSYLDSIGVSAGKYVVALGRFVEEKNFHQLIEAYCKANVQEDYKLVIAGDADHDDAYSQSLKRQAKDNGIVLTGFIKGEKLNQLMSNASLFVLPSSHEGLPIAMLEAMSYEIDVLASDIPANRLSQLSSTDFFEVENIGAMSAAISRKLTEKSTPRTYDLKPYDWDHIAHQTLDVYNKVLKR